MQIKIHLSDLPGIATIKYKGRLYINTAYEGFIEPGTDAKAEHTKEDEPMSEYSVCPHCGANLDPNERCDCLITGCKNIRSLGMMTIKDVGTFPAYELTDLGPDEWNQKALTNNRKSFEQVNGRPPESEEELWEWVYRMSYGERALLELARFYTARGDTDKAIAARQRYLQQYLREQRNGEAVQTR